MDQSLERFERLVAPGHGRIDGALDEAAFLIAAVLDPPVVVDDELTRLDRLAAESGADELDELLAFLFRKSGFVGDRHDYYDAQNSFLNRVLDRRRGIPISLAVLTMELGRRRGLLIEGVGMPGHFLVTCNGVFIDVFDGGALLDERGCLDVARAAAGRAIELPPDALAATPPGDILERMLRNLRMIAERNQRIDLYRGALTLTTRFPDTSPSDLLLLAQSFAASGRFDRAADLGDRAIVLVPDEGRDKLRAQVQGWRARLN